MRLVATACAALLLTACVHSTQPQAEAGSEIFPATARGAGAGDKPAEPPPPAGTQKPIWATVPDLRIPGWEVTVTQIDEQRFRLHLRMRTLINGGDGEARTAFLRSAREIVDAGGYAGYDVLRYEERIDAGLFFGRRGASGEIRVVQSRTWGL